MIQIRRVNAVVLWFSYHDYRCCIRDPAREGSTPKAWERPATLASDTPRPLYGQKTPKKLVGFFNVSFRTVHWTRIGHASVTVGVCLTLWKEAGVPGEKNHGELARNRQTETSRFEAGGVHCIISSTKFTQEPQRMRHRTTLFSARTPNVARARKTPHPLKRKKSPKIDYIQRRETTSFTIM